MIRLRDKDIKRLARMVDLPEETITKMAAMELLDYNRAVDLLIKYSWRQLYRKDWLKKKDKVAALALEYNCSEGKVKKAILSARNKQLYCSQCAAPITKKMFNENNGLCAKCHIKSIQIDISTS